jgi:hypothetical protein
MAVQAILVSDRLISTVSLTFHSVFWKLYTEPSIGAPTKFRFIWLLRFKGEYFLEIDRPEIIIAYLFDWFPSLVVLHLYTASSL